MIAFDDPRATVVQGDCLAVMRAMAERGERFDAIVTDPPYGASEMEGGGTKMLGHYKPNRADGRDKRSYIEGGTYTGFWEYDPKAFQEWSRKVGEACHAILKPGGHLLAFGGARYFHRFTAGIEDAGFEIRDVLLWLHAAGVPKDKDVGEQFLKRRMADAVIRPWLASLSDVNGVAKLLGVTPDTLSAWLEDESPLPIGLREVKRLADEYGDPGWINRVFGSNGKIILDPALDIGMVDDWQGWGSSLKPAYDPILLARRPLEARNLPENVREFGTGAINVGGWRVPGPNGGYWPPNVVTDGSDEVEEALLAYAPRQAAAASDEFFSFEGTPAPTTIPSRLFHVAKSRADDREGSVHPTVKPISLMKMMISLVVPPNGRVLDPFAGSGTTLAAALDLGFKVTCIEQKAEYVADIVRRAQSRV